MNQIKITIGISYYKKERNKKKTKLSKRENFPNLVIEKLTINNSSQLEIEIILLNETKAQ